MIQPQSVLIFHKPIDFRCGHDKLAILSRRASGRDPRSGTLFVFRNRGCNAAKMLIYDGMGLWLLHMRLSQGKFPWWPGSADFSSVSLARLVTILNGNKAVPDQWQRIDTPEVFSDQNYRDTSRSKGS